MRRLPRISSNYSFNELFAVRAFTSGSIILLDINVAISGSTQKKGVDSGRGQDRIISPVPLAEAVNVVSEPKMSGAAP